MDTGITTVKFENLAEWQPQGTVIAFLGKDSILHATIHSAGIASMVPLKPELATWNVVVIDADEQNLPVVMKILHSKNVWGLVFSQPLKSAALKILSPAFTAKGDNIAEAGLGGAEANAERVGAVNIALWRPTGYWGVSTDGAAISWALEDSLKAKFKGKTIFIIGAGAFGRAVAVEALSQGCREIWIGNRTQDHAWDALDQIVPSINMRARVHTFNLLKPSPKVPKNGIVVNTLPPSVRQSDTAVVNLERFDRSSLYFDTALANTCACDQASNLGISFANGKRLFAYQAQRQIELLAGVNIDLEMIVWTVNEAASMFSTVQ